MTTDLRELLDSGLEDGPPHRPIAERLTAGRRVVRRRRRGAIAGSAAAILAAAGLALSLVAPRGDARAGPGPVPAPTISATPIPVQLMVAPPRYVSADTPPVLYLYGRMFKRDRDVTVLSSYGEIDGSFGQPRGAAIVRVDGRTDWVVVVGNEPEALAVEKPGAYDVDLFTAWVQLQLPRLSGHLALAATAPGAYAPPVSEADSPAFFEGTVLVARPGGTVVQRIRHPLTNQQAVPPCHAQGVRIHRPDEDWFVVGFDCRGLIGLYSEPVGVRADTLSAWLAQVKRVQDEYAF